MKKIILSVFLVLNIGCYEKNSPKEIVGKKTEYKVVIDNAKQFALFDFFHSIDLVPLETNRKSHISKISQIQKVNEKIYIRDETQNILFVFDHKGKYLFRINNKGKGPGEYYRMDDFIVQEDGSIAILDVVSKSLIHFDKTGDFIKRTRNDFGALYFEKLNENLWCYAVNNECNQSFCSSIILQEQKGHSSKDYLTIPKNMENLNLKGKTLFKVNGGVKYVDPLLGHVYGIFENGVKSKEKIDFGENNSPNSWAYEYDWNGDVTRFLNKTQQKGYATLIDDYYENEENVFFTFVHKKNTYFFNYNNKTKNTKIAKFPFSYKGKDIFSTDKVIGRGDGVMMALNPDRIKKNIAIFSEVQKKKIKTIKYDDNPVLITYTFN